MQLASPSAAEIPELHPIFATRRSSFDENESPDAADVGANGILRGYLNALQNAGSGDTTTHEASFVQDDDAFLDGARRVQEHLQQVTADGASSCLICLEDIRPTDPIWHCCGAGEPHACYVVLHLGCIQSWARQQLAVAAAALVRNAAAFADGDPTHRRRLAKTYADPCWGCPKCRKEYPGSNIPSASKCFCGQTVDAPFDPWNAPHSCGSQCSRPNEHCGHECLLLCHPGPCPPCPRAVPATCHCGKQHAHRRCGRTEFSCNARCDKTLPCGHACNATCHPGPCPPCPLRSTATCPCGAASKELPCAGHGAFRCDKVCGRSLACAVHSCRRVCCDGNCGPCPLSGKKSCPCGKVTSTEATCGVVVPPCGQTCDKVLECGVHRCTERCHEGACPSTCRATVEKTCACGKMTRSVLCSESFRCERRCASMRSCGRHQCRKRCCAGDCPPCTEICGRRLKCGNHKCQSPCHAGPCPPCPLTSKVSCACGRTSYNVPCGREASAVPPRCPRACPIPPTCRHRDRGGSSDVLKPHRCHFGPCPQCPLPCATVLKCGHTCAAPRCHDAPPPAVAAFRTPPAPLALGAQPSKRQLALMQAPPPALAVARALASNPRPPSAATSACPSCKHPVTVTCVGGHVSLDQPCHVAKRFACDQACGRILDCTNCRCERSCHDPTVDPCPSCTKKCSKPRECSHDCPRGTCHPGDCGTCERTVTSPCFCGKTSLDFPCWRLHSPSTHPLTVEEKCCDKVCSRPLPGCPHLCTARCHDGPCPASKRCAAETTVRCGCKRIKRKMACHEVAALLRAKGGSGSYDGSTALKVLDCDESCAANNADKQRQRSSDKSSFEEKEIGGTAATVGFVTGKNENCSSMRSHKKAVQRINGSNSLGTASEQQSRRETERLARQRRQYIGRVVLLSVLAAGAVAMAMFLRWALRTADKHAQDAWGLGDA